MAITPFKIFDNDPQFLSDLSIIPTYVRAKLGFDNVAGNCSTANGVSVELSDNMCAVNFEDAAMEMSSIVNAYHAKSNLASLLGMMTGTLSGSENKYPWQTLEFEKRVASAFGSSAGVGGEYKLRSGSLQVSDGVQDYDLNVCLGVTTGSNERLEILDVWHWAPFLSYRFYSQSSYINYSLNEFGIKYFTPETSFYCLPTFEDYLRTAQYKFSHKLRRSNYTWELKNNMLRLFPMPVSANIIWLEYRIVKLDPFQVDHGDDSVYGVSNISNVPFGYIPYSKLNSLSKQWIRRMCLALCKETLGNIRSKFSSIPIPNADITLNGSDLIQQGQKEADDLRTELKGLLNETLYSEIMKREQEKIDAEMQIMKHVPLLLQWG
jgi:hypothetical protein